MKKYQIKEENGVKFLFDSEPGIGDKVITPNGPGEVIVKRQSVRFPDKEIIILVEFDQPTDPEECTEAWFQSDQVVLKKLGKLDPGNPIEPETWITEDEVLGFMFGGGDDGLGFFVLK